MSTRARLLVAGDLAIVSAYGHPTFEKALHHIPPPRWGASNSSRNHLGMSGAEDSNVTTAPLSLHHCAEESVEYWYYRNSGGGSRATFWPRSMCPSMGTHFKKPCTTSHRYVGRGASKYRVIVSSLQFSSFSFWFIFDLKHQRYYKLKVNWD